MALESAVFISDLDPANPPPGDPLAQADDHMRLIKSTVKATFPNITGAVTPTHTELNRLAGITGNVQSQLDAEITARTAAVAAKASLASPAFTGVPTAPTPTAGDNSNTLATTAFVNATSFVSALPGQTGNAGKFLTTNGSAASWAALPNLTRQNVAGTAQTAAAGNDYWLNSGAATAVTLPASPSDLDEIAITPANGLLTNTVDSGAVNVRGPASTASGVITLNIGARMQLKYSSTLAMWVMV